MHVGIIKDIWRYPVKSMGGERLASTQIEARGCADDRCWAVREDATGEFVGGRKLPRLMMLKARYLDEPVAGFGPAARSKVAIEYPDGRVVASDDPLASAILSMFVGQRVSLCPRPAASDKQAHRLHTPMSPQEIRYALGLRPDDPDPDFSGWSVKILMTLARYTTPPGALYDVYPLHFLTTAALETMRGHYPEGDFRAERYRPNFVIQTLPDLRGMVENDWAGMDLQIGDARIQCHVPTIRCSMPGAAQPGIEKDPKIPLALMRFANQHLGAYASPRTRAQIRVGDVVKLVPRSSGRLSVGFDQVGRRMKSRMIGLSNRLATWQESRAASSALAAKPVHPKGFAPYTLVERRQEASDIVSLVFSHPARGVLPPFVPGQHVVLAIPRGDGGFVYRSYSLSAAMDGVRYRITVKREIVEADGGARVGAGSSWLHDKLAVGDHIAIKAPGGQFADIPTDTTPLVLISAGIGITPFMAMLQSIAAQNPQRQVSLLHGIRRVEDFAFADELRTLCSSLAHARFKVFISGSGEPPHPPLTEPGRMDICEQLKSLRPAPDTVYFLCGNPAFTADMCRSLLAAGIDEANIRMESFGRSQVVDRGDTSCYEIRCTRSQRILRWDPQQESLLSFFEEQGIAASSGCRYGACQSCAATLLSGEVMYPPEVQPPAGKNKILLCSARPASALELEL